MPERRRDNRLDVELPYLLTDLQGKSLCRCRTLDVSPTGILLEIEKGKTPEPGTIVNVSIQGPAESSWEHINTRPMRVIRVDEQQVALTYADTPPQ